LVAAAAGAVDGAAVDDGAPVVTTVAVVGAVAIAVAGVLATVAVEAAADLPDELHPPPINSSAAPPARSRTT
jgi:hypothetical protein